MIKLRNNPIEGSAVKLNLAFRDSTGTYYIPVSVSYTFLALNKDNESWRVVDNLYKKPLSPASVIGLVIPNMKQIPGTTLQRKILVNYEAFLNNEYVEFVDEVTFDVQPVPTIHYDGPEPESEVYVQVVSCDLTAGSVVSAPTNPQFKMVLNMPVNTDEAEAKLVYDGGEIECNLSPDTTKQTVMIYPPYELENSVNYQLQVSGLKSLVGSYVMKETFKLGFVTVSAGAVVQNTKNAEYNHNGDYIIEPDDSYDAMHEVHLIVDVPIEDVSERTFTENGINWIEPEEGKDAIRRCKVIVDVPLQEEKSAVIDHNGLFEITPDDGFTAIKKVIVDVNSQAYIEHGRTFNIEDNGHYLIQPTLERYQGMDEVEVNVEIPMEESKNVTVSEDGVVDINPSHGYSAMKQVHLTVNAGGLKAYTSDNLIFYSTKVIGSSGEYTIIVYDSDTNKALSWFEPLSVFRQGSLITVEYGGTEYTVVRTPSEDING